MLAITQKRDDLIIEGQEYEDEKDYRRKRSLKFRAKMRDWRKKVFKDPFHRKVRKKNKNKILAAKRR